MRRAALLAAALLAALAGAAAHAHTRSVSYSSWELEGREARVRFRIPQLELTRLPWGIVAPPRFAAELGRYLTDGLRPEGSDGHVGLYPYPTLRALCRCAGCTGGH